ncbi:unnamed protein product [Calicophoron daubneyi]|uniref:Uncharacterized protein n=1 Tax=Calicophoron daubneyi TaxID=300641 RepID=A0AAV2TLW1_CALDB
MRGRSPYENANIISKLLFLWLNPVFSKARKGGLADDDIHPCTMNESAENVTNNLERTWNEEKDRFHPNFLKAIFMANKWYLLLTAATLFCEMGLQTAKPIIMQQILLEFENIDSNGSLRRAGIFSGIFIITTFLALYFSNTSFWFSFRMGLRLRVAVSGLIYRKVLRLNQKALLSTAAGQIINLLSTDVQRFEYTFLYIHYGWVGIVQAVVIFCLMSRMATVPTVCGMVVVIFFVPMQSVLNKVYAGLKTKVAKTTDQRIRLISDIVNGIRIIKLHAWEEIFSNYISAIRRREINLFLKARLCQSFQFTQVVYQVKIGTLAMVLALVLRGQTAVLRSSTLFPLLNFLNTLFLTFTVFVPTCLVYFFDTTVSCSRVKKFLLIAELEGERQPHVVETDQPQIHCSHVSALWDESDKNITLRDISFKFSGPQLIAVVGPVGCGKSSLLQVVLGELPHYHGLITRSRNVYYMPQQPWIFPGTIRDNVLCSLPYDEARYQEVLSATTLNVDISFLPNGDYTQVGERGVSLSGGQKARIGLARVAYAQSTFVLLDDPLAAVDARVANHLFDHCICGILSDRLRLLVTHQIHLLPKVDKILVIKDGRIAHHGTYDELMEQKVDFHELEDPTHKKLAVTENQVMDSSAQELSGKSSVNLDMSLFDKEQVAEQQMCTAEEQNSVDSPNINLGQKLEAVVKISGKADLLNGSLTADWTRSSESKDTELFKSLDQALGSDDGSALHSERKSERNELKFSGSMRSKIHRPSITEVSYGSVHMVPLSADDFEVDIPDINADTDEAENRQTGAIGWRHYTLLGKMGGGICGLISVLILFVLTVVNYAGCDLWLTYWSSGVDRLKNLNTTTESDGTNLWDPSTDRFNLMVYGVLSALLIVISSGRSIVFFGVLLNSSKRLHDLMLKACLHTRLRFFEINPSGRILNRFAKDIVQLDDYLPTVIHDFMQTFFLVLNIATVTVIASYWMIIPTVPLLITFYVVCRYYLFTSRELKRMEANARSPMYGWVSVSVQGLPCIRAARSEDYEIRSYEQLVDKHTGVFYMNIAAVRWLSVRLDLVCALFVTMVVCGCLILAAYSSLPGANVGLMITYASGLLDLFQYCLRQSAEVENQMVSVERTVEYIDLEPEITKPPVYDVPNEWPSQGEVDFNGVWLRYHESAPWALKDIQLQIDPGMKVGIVGRTGAGKSSLISAIFRLVEFEIGEIIIDGIDIARLNLQQLRRRISIIPQDPIMFSGTIRTNLDPLGEMSDERIWNALLSVQLHKLVSGLPKGLDAPITEGGQNLSTGQRQLLALARAILGNNRILVVDEATANVDPGTDAIIQRTLRVQFSSCTVLTVAHRLRTVIDNDLIVVMENGRIVEVGIPHVLLNPELAGLDREKFAQTGLTNSLGENSVTGSGPLASLVRQTGPTESRLLSTMASKAFAGLLSNGKA